MEQLTQIQSDYAEKCVVVTGASGYLGTAILRRLAPVRCTIRRVSRSAGLAQIAGKAKVVDVVADLRDPEAAMNAVSGADVVFHLSAQTSVPVAESDPLADADVNIKPAVNLLEACRRGKAHPAIVFASTATVVGIAERLPVSETCPTNPVTVYDLHKAIVEQYITLYAHFENVRGTMLRLPNVYGPGSPSRQSDRGILNQMISRALRGEELTVFGTGGELRDFLYVDDAISAFLLAGTHIAKLNGRPAVVASGEGRTIAQAINTVADRAARVTGVRVSVRHVPAKDTHLIDRRNYVGDATLLRSLTGWQPTFTFKEGIDATINALRQA